ncbi:hypothetical protein [Streptosporangium sp. NPDC002721]|uniref:hypothetical protein n=1 Tax=Streptosporangium sp. NPDC002721 TaxID=3366188 RepID=UPI0036739F35
MWGDWTCVGEALAPQAESFGAWYHDWLEVSLREVLGERIEATVRDETGWSVDRRLLGLLPPPLADGDEQPTVKVLRLARRIHLALYERRDGDARDLLSRAHAVGAGGDHEAVRLALAEAVFLREEGLIADAPLGRGLRSAGHPRPADRTPVALRLRAGRLAWECRHWGHPTDAPRFDAITTG